MTSRRSDNLDALITFQGQECKLQGWLYGQSHLLAVNFVRSSNHALAGAYKPLHGAQKFLVMVL